MCSSLHGCQGDHGDLDALGDDDHTQYFRVDGTRDISGQFDIEKAFGTLWTGTVTAEANPRVQFDHDAVYFGPGGGAGPDAYLQRVDVGVVTLGDVGEILVPSLGAPATPVGGRARLYLISGFGAFPAWPVVKLSSGAELGPIGEIAGALSYRGQWGAYIANTNTLAGTGFGVIGNPVLTGVEASAIDNGGRRKTYTTLAVVGSNAGVESQAVFMRRNSAFSVLIKARVEQAHVAGQQRMFVGLTNDTLANMLAADAPAAGMHFVGLLCRSTDSNWQWVSRGGGSLGVATSGIAVGITDIYLRITQRGSTSLFLELLDSAFTVLATRTQTLNLPGISTDLGFALGIQSLDGVARAVGTHYGEFVARGV